ncbi:MAG: metal-dependent hydrolase [Acidobacteriota bacterium]
MKIYWLGHSAVKIEGSKTVFIDPFLTGNPLASTSIDKIDKADIVIVTHDHEDHLGDSFAICKKTGATLVSVHEISVKASNEGIKSEGMNIGGTVEVDGVKIHMVQATHSAYSTHPVGVVVEMDGKRIYHAGDTGLFSDMKLIGEFYKPDLTLLPIDGRYNMDVVQASKAAEFIKAKNFIPIHYDTFPIVKASPEKFKEMVGRKGNVIILKPGEFFTL